MGVDPPVARLQELVRIPTVSRADESAVDWAQFERFAATLARLYPLVHATLELDVVAGHTLLYRWRGSERGAASVLMAHFDVVPADADGWDHPPFEARVVGEGDEQAILGRGTIDDKGSLAAILEAVEQLVAEGHSPRNDLYLSFGHDEETAGSGAAAVAELLRSRGIRPALVLDEGGAVVEGVFPRVAAQMAVVGVSEKGTLTLALTVEQHGGHASTPPRLTAPARLARAIVRLGNRPFPARLSAVNREMIRRAGAHATGLPGFAFRAVRVTSPLLLLAFGRLGDETRAITRTTQSVTMLAAGTAPNALAERAEATVNIRIAVGSSVAAAIEHVRRAIRDDSVAVRVVSASEPSPVSPSWGPAWELLESAVLDTFPGSFVTPYVQLGASDSRHFTGVSEHVYRFTPFDLTASERSRLHARNESIRVASYLRGVQFYRRLAASL